MNSIILGGRLTKDPEVRYTKNNDPVATFIVAVRRDKDNADFFRCIAFKQKADVIQRYFVKGSQIFVRGRMQSREYEKDGISLKTWETVVDEIEFGAKSDKPAEKHALEEITEEDGDLPF